MAERKDGQQTILTAAEMRALEGRAIASGAVSGLELMERAGRGVVEAVLQHWPELARGAHRALVLCGPGNNGGDGYVVARLLAGRGWQVTVLALGDPARLPPDAAANRARWEKIGPVHPLTDDARPAEADLVVDALFGIGLARPVRLPLDSLRRAGRRAVAVDLPSGLDADTGQVVGDGAVFPAELTVTFHALKPGHVSGLGPELCGTVVVCDIGLPKADG